MNKNVENYKKAVDQIHVDSNLKEKVLEEVEKKQKKKMPIYYLRYATAIAAVAIVAIVGVSFINKNKEEILQPDLSNKTMKTEETERMAAVNIKRFESMEELRKALEQEQNYRGIETNGVYFEEAKGLSSADALTENVADVGSANSDYSRTNNQVESVDEADIVKTDGKYIYYSQNNRVYIVDTDLKLKATIKEENFSPRQIFVNGKKLVVFGTKYNSQEIVVRNTIEDTEEKETMEEDVSTFYRPKTYIRVFDLSNIENPKLSREIKIDGNYQDARMIEDNVYLVTNYYHYFYNLDEVKDMDILPSYEDSITKKVNYVEATDIAYFDDTENYSYSLIAGFNLNTKEPVNIETFFGSGNEMYVSENNLYLITQRGYWNAKESTIYKFQLEDAKVLAVASGTVKGYVGSQFAIDEYEGNLRVATTSWKSNYRGFWFGEDYESHYETHLTIFNENLEKIGEIENLIEDEEIYAVRFIGKVGYVVTFQEIDPLWVIDLSDPTDPQIKGELEIPGYSSYLHPYDETHIIGIGYNVKDNGYGGVTNDTLKISMFDVSDVSHPKEIFNQTLNNKNAYSNISYEHKALFFNKAENLIGFPISWWTRRENRAGLLLYKIDMENNKFEEIDDLIENTIYSSMERAIYIGNRIYTIHMDQIISYDMKTFEKLGTLELEYDDEYDYYYGY